MDRQWQVRFDGGHQQRYLADRGAVLRYVLAIAPHAASTRFEVFAEAVPPGERGPLFGQAADLLDLAGWGLDELYEASRDGPARDELLRSLGLAET